MPKNETLTLPAIHLNGTSADDLLEDQCSAMSAISKAIDVLHRTGPNARDYYTQGPEHFRKAQAEHNARINKLQEVKAEIEQIAEHISDARTR
jgi:hypothetical protein